MLEIARVDVDPEGGYAECSQQAVMQPGPGNDLTNGGQGECSDPDVYGPPTSIAFDAQDEQRQIQVDETDCFIGLKETACSRT